MLTRLLLLGALLMSEATPPDGGHAEHCGAQVEEAMPGHQGHAYPSTAPTPTDRPHQHCPPVECAMTAHCVPALALPIEASGVPAAFRTSHQAPRTSRILISRLPEPPTPPPDRSL